MNLITRQLSQEIVTSTLEALRKDLPGLSVPYFQDTPATKRQTFSFGYDYFSMRDASDNPFTPIPDYLQTLCQKCIGAFSDEKTTGEAKDYLNVIVSIYKEGYYLEPHVDVDETDQFADGMPINFYFGKDLFVVILEADETGHLYFVESYEKTPPFIGKKLLEAEETPGAVFLLSGPVRSRPYYHGVSKVTKSRISVTFRTVKFKPTA